MITQPVERLTYLINTIPELLKAIPEAEFAEKKLPGKWSKKEILGHLIDSATNNHQRFIRAQYESAPSIYYDQNKWNELSFYNQRNSNELIDFWALYNKQLVEIMKQIPEDRLLNKCNDQTLEFIIDDYVKHMEYHLNQIVVYK